MSHQLQESVLHSTSHTHQLLSVKNLEVFYGAIHAVKKVSFYIRAGEVVSLIGSNGAGKTSVLRAISGLADSRGTIELLGNDIVKIPAHERIKYGISQSPEGRGIFPNLTVVENLMLGAYTRSDSENVKKDLLHCYQLFPRLLERKNQNAGTLSGGEQQMLSISRALMVRPKILLLDEPSLGLAPRIVQQIFEIIVRLNKEGMTILLVEQNAKMALKISNRAYVLETGEITCEGVGADLLKDDIIRRSYLGV